MFLSLLAPDLLLTLLFPSPCVKSNPEPRRDGAEVPVWKAPRRRSVLVLEPVLKFALQPLLVLSQFLNCSGRHYRLLRQTTLHYQHDDAADEQVKDTGHDEPQRVARRLAEVRAGKQGRHPEGDRHVE